MVTSSRTKEECKTLLIGIMYGISDKLEGPVKESITKIIGHRAKRWIDVVSEKKKQRTFKILDLIKKIRPQYANFVDSVLKSLEEQKLVFDENNEWDPINKLNTNRSDYPIFIADMLAESKKYDIHQIYHDLKIKNDYTNLTQFLIDASKYPDYIWDNFLVNKEKYIQNIKKNSAEGDMIENYVIEKYIDNGWEIIYKGGDGELIDMLFGLDLIVKKGDEYNFVQVKKVPSIEKIKIDNDNYTKVGGTIRITNQSKIDTVAYATLNGDVFIGKKQNYYYRTDGKLIKCYGLPIPSKVSKFEVLVKI